MTHVIAAKAAVLAAADRHPEDGESDAAHSEDE